MEISKVFNNNVAVVLENNEEKIAKFWKAEEQTDTK